MEIQEVKRVWNEVKNELRDTIPAHAYYSWVDALEAAGCDEDKFSLLTVHMMAPGIVRQSYYSQINDAFKKITGREISFSVTYDADLAAQKKKAGKKASGQTGSPPPNPLPQGAGGHAAMDNLAQMQSFSNLNLKYKFDNFVVGENSRFAHAAAFAVAQNPAKKYNPLFVYGASGLGKTHLMQAIGHYVIFNKPKLKVRYIKTEEYVNELIKNLQHGGERNSRMEKFRQKYRNIDVLLIDDIQFLESKTYTMEEIFHTFDSLHNNNKQIVITSDRLPKDIPTLPERLRTRFEMGLVVDITPPDFETRVAILKNLADRDGVKADFAVFEYIANNFVNNVRELEGAYNKVSAFAEIEKTELTLELVQKILKCEAARKAITLNAIAKAVGEHYGVMPSEFQTAARNQKVSNARHIAVYLSRELTGKSFESIAEYFNKKHPTMLYSYEKIRDEIKVNRELADNIATIAKNCKK